MRIADRQDRSELAAVRSRTLRTFFAAAAAIAVTAMRTPALAAQAAQTAPRATPSVTSTDHRWLPWLGCWQPDSSSGTTASGTTCVVPVAGSPSVEALSIGDGQITARRRFDATGAAHAVDDAGCTGSERASWSPGNTRVYLRARYTCAGGLDATSTSLFAMSPSGQWLEVQNVRAGGGSIDRVTRWREAPLPAGLPRSAAAALNARALAVTAARASAAHPVSPDEIVEALRSVDAATVRAWILASGQRFSLTGTQVATLDHADVPPSVLRAMMAAGRTADDAAAADASRQASDAYLRGYSMGEAAYAGAVANPYSAYNGVVYAYPPGNQGYAVYQQGAAYPVYEPGMYGVYGAYSTVGAPIVVVHGGRTGRGDGRDHGNGRDHDGGAHRPAPGPVGVRPSSPPVTHVPSRPRP